VPLFPYDSQPDRLSEAEAARLAQRAERAGIEATGAPEPAVRVLLRDGLWIPNLFGTAFAVLVLADRADGGELLVVAALSVVLALVGVAAFGLPLWRRRVPALDWPPAAPDPASGFRWRRARSTVLAFALTAVAIAVATLVDGWHYEHLAALPIAGTLTSLSDLAIAVTWQLRHRDRQLVFAGDPAGRRELYARDHPGRKAPAPPP
jgi:hypothetical protein